MLYNFLSFRDYYSKIILMNEDEIKEILKKQEETLILVQKLWRAEKWHRLLSIAKYMIFLAIVFSAFYFLIPFVKQGIKLFQDFQNIKTSQDLQKFLQQTKQ